MELNLNGGNFMKKIAIIIIALFLFVPFYG